MIAPSTELVDTHCHLTMSAFDEDRDLVIERAQNAGVHKIVVPGLDIPSSEEAISLSHAKPSIYAAVGIHPHNASEWSATSRNKLLSLAKSKKVVAIGEIGLDFYRNLSPKDIQINVFKYQLEIATELDLPVIIHNREASREVLEILIEWSKSKNPSSGSRLGVLHAFSADLDTAKKVIDAGFLLGIAGPITYKNATNLREITTKIPYRRIIIETDAPYLTPHPKRGKRNEPANVVFVANQLSKTLQQDYNFMARITSENAAGLFGWENGTNNSTLL
jgi:TatD DNase family protein